MKQILVATNNQGKLKEIQEILKEYKLISLREMNYNIEINEDKETFEGNSLEKAKEISIKTGMPCIADDSGLCIEYFGGWPGVHTARFLGENSTARQRNEAILEKMKGLNGKDRMAKVVCVITYYEKETQTEIVVRGEIEGKITTEIRGDNGFGFDEIFELENGKTLAELTNEEKNKISARKNALENLRKQLTNR